ncbi:MAG: ABC transporter ATP-binding protein [Eubacterium sp.]|nr:ABC transporter ATP-binding protein [Eubacterium sp.]
MMRKTTVGWLFGYIRRYLAFVAGSVLMSVISVVSSLYIPVVIGEAVDHIIGKDNVEWAFVTGCLIRIGIAAVAGGVAAFVLNKCNNRVTFGVVRDIRKDAFGMINRLSVGSIESRARGDIISRITTDADAVADGLLLGSSQLFTGVITIIGTLGFMFATSVTIALIVMLVTPVSLLVSRFISKRTYAGFHAQSKDRGEQTAHIEEIFKNLSTVQALGCESEDIKRFDETAEKLKKDSLNATFFSSLTNPVTRFVNSIVYGSVGVVGALYAVRGGISVGVLTCFLSYANQYTKPFNEISGVVAELQNAIACADRLREWMESETEESGDGDTILTETDGRVCIRSVDFSYDKSSPEPLIRDLNLKVTPGSRVAIVGPTGAGKSTIINLLMRFYDADAGSISIGMKSPDDDDRCFGNECDIRRLTRDSLRSQYGMVLQNTWLMSGTVRDNIAFGRDDATDEEIKAAAAAAHAHSFIRRLPDGYDTRISDDAGLSVGQKQLLCIARVMLTLPPMLILDEATSSIDTRTELMIRKAFETMMKGRTSFIVAHRLQTIREADEILVMRDGAVVEQGTHEELMEKKGFYHELYIGK